MTSPDPSPVSSDRRSLPVLPLPGGVVVPSMVVTVAIESPTARAAVDAASGPDGTDELLLVPKLDDRYASVGVIARIESTGSLPSGGEGLVLRAVGRARLGAGTPDAADQLWVTAQPLEDEATSAASRELATELRATLRVLFERIGGRRLVEVLSGVDADDPGALADLAGWWPELSLERKLELLETVDVSDRLRLVLGWSREALTELELTERISAEVREGLDQQQREVLLRRQLGAIRKELGEDPDAEDSVESYRERIDTLAADGAPEAVVTKLRKELGRFESMPEQNPERGWVQGWLDAALDVPWTVRSDEVLDLSTAREVLDADHTGLEDVKERIIELLAVRKLRAERGLEADGGESVRRRPGAILALVGPPGVGKTSLGESIARALDRRFTRVALGGVRDEAEIRGHRRTYVGAQSGRIVRALTEAGTMNPVLLLDEIDKVGNGWRGDPSSALLEVLDPAQNHTFRDHYLEVDLDLSDVVFLTTANVLDTIPGPLRDRLEIIHVDGYTHDEKVAIAREHLLQRQLGANGVAPDEVVIGDSALHTIVAGYTREAGVRELERQLGKALRKLAVRIAEGADTPVVVDEGAVTELLGRQRFHAEDLADRVAVPGVATGLAVTGVGGDVLFVEATVMDGEPELEVTGQLGDVMQESARIARSWVDSHRDGLGIGAEAMTRRFHVHFPAGAVPKDGPSAGITMTTALVSLLTGRSVRAEVAMTGEVTLSGRVLPIGGVKQKVLAADRAGLTEVILPHRNGPDLDDLPDEIRDRMTIHLVEDVTQVLDLALEPAVAAAA